MKPTIVICGYGVGISDALARRFGREGYRVAAVARNRERLSSAVAALTAAGIDAAAYAADVSEPGDVRRVMGTIKSEMGPIRILHWNAYSAVAGDLMTASADELGQVFSASVGGLVIATQAVRGDLKETHGALLVTGGGLAFYDRNAEAAAVSWKSAGLALGKAAQHKLVGLLREALAPDGIYVADVVVSALVKGTAFDRGNATMDPSVVADQFWKIYCERKPDSVTLA